MWPPAAEGPLRPAACRCKKVKRCPGGPGGAGSAQRLISDHHTSDLSLSGVSSTHAPAESETPLEDASRRRLYGFCGTDRPVIVFGISRSPLPQSLVCAPVLQPWRWRSRGVPPQHHTAHRGAALSTQGDGRWSGLHALKEFQIPPPQFRGSCQCVGSLVSYKSLSLKEFYMFLLGIPTFLNKAKMFMAGIKSLVHVFDNFPL